MKWQNAVFVKIENIDYHISVTVGMYATNWIFIVDDMIQTKESKRLLPHKIYLRFDKDKKYLSCFPAKAISPDICNTIVYEIKKYEAIWIRGISP